MQRDLKKKTRYTVQKTKQDAVSPTCISINIELYLQRWTQRLTVCYIFKHLLNFSLNKHVPNLRIKSNISRLGVHSQHFCFIHFIHASFCLLRLFVPLLSASVSRRNEYRLFRTQNSEHCCEPVRACVPRAVPNDKIWQDFLLLGVFCSERRAAFVSALKGCLSTILPRLTAEGNINLRPRGRRPLRAFGWAMWGQPSRRWWCNEEWGSRSC